jgi:hypothetical protein
MGTGRAPTAKLVALVTTRDRRGGGEADEKRLMKKRIKLMKERIQMKKRKKKKIKMMKKGGK